MAALRMADSQSSWLQCSNSSKSSPQQHSARIPQVVAGYHGSCVVVPSAYCVMDLNSDPWGKMVMVIPPGYL